MTKNLKKERIMRGFLRILLCWGVAIVIGATIAIVMPATLVCAENAENGFKLSESEATTELMSRYDSIILKQKPDKYLKQRIDTVLKNALSHIDSNDGETSSYIASVASQMDAIASSVGESTDKYLFLSDDFQIPTVNHGEDVTVILPVINYSTARLTDVIINPDMQDLSTDKWPFEIQNSGYTQTIPSIPPYDPKRDISELRQDLVYTFKVREDVKTGYYPVTFDVLYTYNNKTVSGTIVAYVHIIGKTEYGLLGQNKPEEEEDKFVPQPRIIVTGFETSPAEVYAGDTFTVYIHVKNTSSDMACKNVLFDLQAAIEGEDKTNTYSAFLPTSGSSSVYMDAIAPGQDKDIEIEMTAKADLAQKPYVLEVKMKYDYDKTANVSDTASVSIPIKQESKFDSSTPEIAPGSIAVGEQSNVMFSIYNTGKTTLYNLQFKFADSCVEGGEVFIGNLTSGSTGNVDSMVTGVAPNESGIVTGVISYEDEAGNVVETVKEINLMITEAMDEDFEAFDPGQYDDMMPDENAGPGIGVIIGIVAGAVVLVVVIIIVLVKLGKKRKAKKLLNEDLSFIDGE